MLFNFHSSGRVREHLIKVAGVLCLQAREAFGGLSVICWGELAARVASPWR